MNLQYFEVLRKDSANFRETDHVPIVRSVVSMKKADAKTTEVFENTSDETKLYAESFKIYPQLVSNTRLGRGMRCDEAPIL